MVSWLAGKWFGFAYRRLRAGDIRPVLLCEHPDVEFTFPGENSWGGVHKGKAAVQAWLERVARVGLQLYVSEVVVKGFPWRQTVCVRGVDHLDAPTGERVYDNRYVIWGHLRWGRLIRYEVYEDTVRTLAFDKWLADHEPGGWLAPPDGAGAAVGDGRGGVGGGWRASADDPLSGD